MNVKMASEAQISPQTDQKDVWLKALEIIKRELSEQSFKTWVEPAQFLALTDGALSLEVPDKFYGDWLKEHYQDIVRGAVQDVAGVKPEIKYVVRDRSFKPSSSPITTPSSPKRNQQETSLLNDRYTLQNFVVGPGNRFAHAAMLAVSEAPAKQYNPLFIYGRVGLGKTHLMQGVAHKVLERNPDAKVLYKSGEKFTNHLISAIQKH